jgi:hypothetical protein
MPAKGNKKHHKPSFWWGVLSGALFAHALGHLTLAFGFSIPLINYPMVVNWLAAFGSIIVGLLIVWYTHK